MTVSGLTSEREAEIREFVRLGLNDLQGQTIARDLLAALDRERDLSQRLAAAMQGARNQLDVALEEYRRRWLRS